MDKIAVFVDAGYLFAQGSVALAGGEKKRRTELSLSPTAVVEELMALAGRTASHCRLLRIYWYDGSLPGAQLTSEQSLIADLDDVKLRLGFINGHGQQKGVDSLIVTDLIELSRLNAISDAILVAGDEDLRVGVQIAQNYGVRVHLLGIEPASGSQSKQLLREVDTKSEWSKLTIEKFLSLREAPAPLSDEATAHQSTKAKTKVSVIEETPKNEDLITQEVVAFVASLKESDLRGIVAFWKQKVGAPSDLDKIMLAKSRAVLGRDLKREEMRFMRNIFKSEAQERISALK